MPKIELNLEMRENNEVRLEKEKYYPNKYIFIKES
jgi:hypothetical protein